MKSSARGSDGAASVLSFGAPGRAREHTPLPDEVLHSRQRRRGERAGLRRGQRVGAVQEELADVEADASRSDDGDAFAHALAARQHVHVAHHLEQEGPWLVVFSTLLDYTILYQYYTALYDARLHLGVVAAGKAAEGPWRDASGEHHSNSTIL